MRTRERLRLFSFILLFATLPSLAVGHQATVVCTCGATFQTGTTKDTDIIKVEICNKCHPYFTGKQKLVDAGGRVDKFKKKYGLQ